MKNPYAYTSREWEEETGDYYYRARYYNSCTGRFLSQDPIGFAGGDSNLYRYVRNNPLIFTDAFGLRTDGIGFSVNVNAFGLGGTFEVSYVTDDKGGTGFAIGGGIGAVAGTPGVSATFQTQHTNAPTINDLNGAGSQTGLSGFAGIGGGSEIITSGSYVGITTNVGIGTPGAAFSVIPTGTSVYQTTPSTNGGMCGGK